MTENAEAEISMKRYLLGELAEPEQQELEEGFMTSNECFEQLLIAEDKLVDEYLRGTLSVREEERFNDYFLCTPERSRALRFSKSLRKYVLNNTEQPRTVWGWPGLLNLQLLPHRILEYSLAAALSLMVLGGSWLTFRIQRLDQLIEQVRSQQTVPAGQPQDWQQQLAQLRERKDQLAGELRLQKERRAELEQQVAALRASKPQRSPSSMVAFALTPGVVRSLDGTQKVNIPANAHWVQLELYLVGDDYQKYQIQLQREGNEIYSLSTPKIKIGNDTEAVVLTLPAKLLPHGIYTLKLYGINPSSHPEAVETYSFTVPQK